MTIHELAISALGAALDGERVAFFEDSLADASKVFRLVEASAPSSCTIRRVNGNQSVTTRAGGSVHFFSVRSQGNRGMGLDRVYIPAKIASEDIAVDIEACLATSKHPKFIGYL